MSNRSRLDDWKHRIRMVYSGDRPVEYSVHFYRLDNSGWYDELRYDSHEIRKGKEVFAPHLHLKLRSGFKLTTEQCVEEIEYILQ